jgi:ribosomal protein S18 acetylase RimI-like enzyme
MQITLRDFVKEDRPAIDAILSRIEVFDDEDRALALELIDIALDIPEQKDYFFYVAENESNIVVGYLCYGPTPLTDGTYDLYWIAVDPEYAGHGIGTLLLKHFENKIRQDSGHLILIETSSNEEYAATRQFYLKNNYQLAETIKDFYRIGEDRVTYTKYLSLSPAQ